MTPWGFAWAGKLIIAFPNPAQCCPLPWLGTNWGVELHVTASRVAFKLLSPACDPLQVGTEELVCYL